MYFIYIIYRLNYALIKLLKKIDGLIYLINNIFNK